MKYLSQCNYKICRTCLKENSNIKSIFTFQHIPEMEQKILISDMLMSFASILIRQGDGFPENICHSCWQQVSTAYLFKRLCEKSDATLRECVNLNNSTFIIATDQYDKNIKLPLENDKVLNKNDLKCGFNPDNKKLTGNPAIYSKSKLAVLITNNKKDISTSKRDDNKIPKIKIKNETHRCELCNKSFKFQSNLRRHKLIHTGERPFLCNVCGKGFTQMAYLKVHTFTHTGEKPYHCQLCEKAFAAPGTLMTHIRTHTGERPHICNICGKDFPQSSYLATHKRTHTGEKPVECKVCSRRFNQSGGLVVHMRVHSGEKPYHCNECGTCFAIRGTLKKHLRTHTGERPHKCKMCGQAFAQNGTLTKHMKIHLKL